VLARWPFPARGCEHALHRVTQINARNFRPTPDCSMDEDRVAVVRRKLAFYRECLAKGVDGGSGMIYLVEITKLELLLEEIDDTDKKGRGLSGKV
jgi:hypothetical protein